MASVCGGTRWSAFDGATFMRSGFHRYGDEHYQPQILDWTCRYSSQPARARYKSNMRGGLNCRGAASERPRRQQSFVRSSVVPLRPCCCVALPSCYTQQLCCHPARLQLALIVHDICTAAAAVGGCSHNNNHLSFLELCMMIASCMPCFAATGRARMTRCAVSLSKVK